jgi:hypothetical protein
MELYKFIAIVNGKTIEGSHWHDMKWNCIAEAMTFLYHTEAKDILEINPGGIAKYLFNWEKCKFVNKNIELFIVENERQIERMRQMKKL